MRDIILELPLVSEIYPRKKGHPLSEVQLPLNELRVGQSLVVDISVYRPWPLTQAQLWEKIPLEDREQFSQKLVYEDGIATWKLRRMK